MAKMAVGVDGPDLGMGPDLAAVGNSARAPKSAGAAPQNLVAFSVRKGDDGGIIVGEDYEKTPPKGRRVGAGFPGGSNHQDSPFAPDDGAGAMAHVTDLLGQMGMDVTAPEPDADEAPAPPGAGGPMVAPPPKGGAPPDMGGAY